MSEVYGLLGGHGPFKSSMAPRLKLIILFGPLNRLVDGARGAPTGAGFTNRFVGGPDGGRILTTVRVSMRVTVPSDLPMVIAADQLLVVKSYWKPSAKPFAGIAI